MRVTITGGTGRIGRALAERLRAAGADSAHGADAGDPVTLLSRDPDRGVRWDPQAEPAPAAALAGRDAVVHLAGEDVAQRWSAEAKRRIRDSRVLGTRNLVAGLAQLAPEQRPRVLVSGSASGYYGPRGDEPVDESEPPGTDFLAEVCAAWEREALAAEALGLRVVRLRTGLVLDRRGGALARMLPFFRAGLGGPVAGGRQWMPWIALDDELGLILAALQDETWTGPINASAPEPATNRELSRALGRALRRPAVLPVPGLAIRALYGEMAEIVTSGVRMVPRRALELGYAFAQPSLEAALRATLGR